MQRPSISSSSVGGIKIKFLSALFSPSVAIQQCIREDSNCFIYYLTFSPLMCNSMGLSLYNSTECMWVRIYTFPVVIHKLPSYIYNSKPDLLIYRSIQMAIFSKSYEKWLTIPFIYSADEIAESLMESPIDYFVIRRGN
jgi:hypothetical protein